MYQTTDKSQVILALQVIKNNSKLRARAAGMAYKRFSRCKRDIEPRRKVLANPGNDQFGEQYLEALDQHL
jgi:hypothetical protein